MLFHNPGPHVLRFAIGELAYQVAAGGEVDIPAPLAYVVKGRGLPLVAGPGAAGAERSEAERVVVVPRRMPDGVEVGPLDEDDEDAGTEAEADVSPVVEKAVADLNAAGLRLPRKRRK